MIRQIRFAIHYYPLALYAQIFSIIFITLVVFVAAYLWFEVPLTEPYKQAIPAAAGGLLGYAIAHMLALDKVTLESMTKDSRQATVLLLEYFTYCKTGNPIPLDSVIQTILSERLLPSNLLLELYCHKQRLASVTQTFGSTLAPQTGQGIIPFPPELLKKLESISGIKCADWLRVCTF